MVGKMFVKREIFSHLLALDDYLLALTFYDEYDITIVVILLKP